MEFGILFTSHPNTEAEPYPHRDVHARVTRQVVRADELGYNYAWVAEHHFSNEYGIMPDVFVYAAYLAALTKRIKIGTAVVTLPLANPLRVAENTAFVDILSQGRFALGLGSGYRKYEFDVKIPDRDMTPANFRTIARIDELVSTLMSDRSSR